MAGMADLSIAIDGGEPQWYSVPVGEDLELPVTLPHGGQNILQFGYYPMLVLALVAAN